MPGWRNWQTQRTQNPPGFGPWGFDSPSRHQPSDSTITYVQPLTYPTAAYPLNNACCAGHQREPHGKQASHNLALRQNRRGMEISQADLRSQQQNQAGRRRVLHPMAQRLENGVAALPQCSECGTSMQALSVDAYRTGIWHRQATHPIYAALQHQNCRWRIRCRRGSMRS